MQVGEYCQQPYAPDDQLYYVFAHHGAAFCCCGVFCFKMQAHQAEHGFRDPSEQEPCANDNGQFYHAYLEVFLVDELVIEDVPAHIAEVEYVGRPVDADHDRTDNKHGQYHFVCEGIEPCLGDGSFREIVFLLVHLQVV